MIYSKKKINCLQCLVFEWDFVYDVMFYRNYKLSVAAYLLLPALTPTMCLKL